jgi:poly(A) polymerase Pap1
MLSVSHDGSDVDSLCVVVNHRNQSVLWQNAYQLIPPDVRHKSHHEF